MPRDSAPPSAPPMSASGTASGSKSPPCPRAKTRHPGAPGRRRGAGADPQGRHRRSRPEDPAAGAEGVVRGSGAPPRRARQAAAHGPAQPPIRSRAISISRASRSAPASLARCSTARNSPAGRRRLRSGPRPPPRRAPPQPALPARSRQPGARLEQRCSRRSWPAPAWLERAREEIPPETFEVASHREIFDALRRRLPTAAVARRRARADAPPRRRTPFSACCRRPRRGAAGVSFDEVYAGALQGLRAREVSRSLAPSPRWRSGSIS